jgi:hypothetical protein
MSLIVILLLKNIDLKKYSIRIKDYILENITYVKDEKARKNMI